MADDLTTTETRLIQANKKLRAQNDELTSENDGLQLRCEKLQATLDQLTAHAVEQQRGRDSSHESYALVVRPDSPGHQSASHLSDLQSAAPAAVTEARFRDIAEILTQHNGRVSQLEKLPPSILNPTEPTAAEKVFESTAQTLESRIASLEARSAAAADGVIGGGDSVPAKEDKKILRVLEQLRVFMRRVESREKHEREIDMADTRDRLYELWGILGRNENDGQVRRAGPFEGTSDDFAVLRDRVITRLAGFSAYDKAFMEAKAAAHKTKSKTPSL